MRALRIDTIEKFIELYPLLFSQKRLLEWRELFSAKAIMVKVNKKEKTSFLTIDEAMPEQIEYAEENTVFEEIWTNAQTNYYGNIAVVKVDYTLTANNEIREGVDVATLSYDDIQGWKIISLIYEQTKFTIL